MSKLPASDAPPESDSWLGYAPWVAVIFTIVLLVAYGWVFSALPWTENSTSWGAFGDYIGGLLNPTIALFTLIVAVRVWRLQRTQLSETKLTLEKQTAHLSAANLREQQSGNEKLFFSVMEKVETTANTMSTNFSIRPRNEHINSLAGILWSNTVIKDGQSFNFADKYGRHDQASIDLIVDSFQPQLSTYLDLIQLALEIIKDRIDDEKIFVQLFCAQIGQAQLSLICYMACGSQFKELHELISYFKLHEKLPKNEYDQHLQYRWYS